MSRKQEALDQFVERALTAFDLWFRRQVKIIDRTGKTLIKWHDFTDYSIRNEHIKIIADIDEDFWNLPRDLKLEVQTDLLWQENHGDEIKPVSAATILISDKLNVYNPKDWSLKTGIYLQYKPTERR